MNDSNKNSKKNLNRLLSSFLERNYNTYMNKINYRNNFLNLSSKIDIYQLNNILYDLKQKYNSLLIYNQKRSKKITQILIHLKEEKERLYTILEKKDKIEFIKEDIIIPNFKSTNIAKEEIEKNIFSLTNKKKSIDNLFKAQEDYHHILEYLMECEKKNNISQKKELVNIVEKIRQIKRCQKILDNYLIKNDAEEKDYILLKNKISGSMKLIRKVNRAQSMNIDKIKKEIKEKEFEISNLNDGIKELKEILNQELNIPKKEFNKKIQEAKEYKKNKLKTEKKYIEIINCFSFIQKQIYENNNKNNDKNKMLEIRDYQYNESNKEEKNNLNLNLGDKTQKSSIYSFNLNNKSIFDPFTVKNNNKIKSLFRNKRKRNEIKNVKKIWNKTSSTLYQTLNNFSTINDSKNNISILVNKLQDIKITKNEIFEYLNNIMAKSEFYRNQLNLLRDKEIKLENLKNDYTAKAKNIISNNFFKFDELTKNNKKCKEFLERNELFLNRIKITEQKLIKNKILNHIKDNLNINDNNKNQDFINEEYINNTFYLFRESKNLISIIRKFFLICSDLLKDIYISISKDENCSTSNLEKYFSDNSYIDVLKKINEYYDNEEVIISKDYKLLLQYIKNLLKFCKQNKNALSKDALEEIISNLFNKFYLPGELNNKLDKDFIERFLAKKNKNYNNIFINFTQLVEPALHIIKSLYNLINSDENIKLLNNNKTENEEQSNEIKYNTISSESKRNYKRLNNYIPSKYESKSVNDININDELCKDNDDYEDSHKNKNIINITKNKRHIIKVKLIDKKVADKLYEPFMAKTSYMKKLNFNIPKINKLSNRISKENNQIIKKMGEVTRNMNIFENSDVYTNKLSDTTYNSILKLIQNNT